LIPPFVLIDGVDEAASFDTESCSRPSRWNITIWLCLDVLPSVKLEGWFGTKDVQVKLRLRMADADQRLELSLSGVQW
jgi:hypothetical protein